MMPWAAAVSKSPSNTQHLLQQQQQQHQQIHHNHQQHLLQQHQQQQQHHHLQQQQHQHQNNILNANNHNQNNSSFEPYTGSIGCWTLPESNNSSSRGGWNANDGTLKGDGVADDGTAIWGATKKTGIDWTEKELLLNPPKANNSTSSEKRIQKTETSISSINGTEAWGAPAPQPISSSNMKSTTSPSTTINNPRNCNDSQSQLSNDNSGKNDDFGSIDTIGWGGDSSLSSRAKTVTTNENSSPSINSNNVWNISGLSKQQPQAKASDWLTGANSSNGNNIRPINQNNVATNPIVARQQLEQQQQKNLSDVVGSTTNSNQFIQSISSSNSKTSRDSNAPAIGGNNGGQGNNIGSLIGASSANNNINDLKLSANYSNDLLDSPNRQLSNSVTSNNRQSQFDSAAYANNNSNGSSTNSNSTANTPSRDLLKQMVNQIHLAVQAGHLNPQILNQPLSNQTLQLVYQLLQQIKNLHQLQHLKANSNSSSSSTTTTTSSTIDMQINRTTNNISLLHKAITQQQSTMGKADQQQQIGNLGGGDKQKQQQQNSANNYSYATISKMTTTNNQKVPSSANNIINSNIDSFNKSSLIDSLKNDSNSDTLRAVQAKFDSTPANTTNNNNFDKTNQFNSAPMQASSSADNVLVGNSGSSSSSSNNNSSNNNKPIAVSSGDFSSKVQANFMNATNNQQTSQQQLTNNNTNSKSGNNLLWGQSSTSSSSSGASASSSSAAWSIFNSSGDYNPQQSGWPSQLRISSNQVSQQQDHHHQQHQQQQHQHPFGAFDMASDFNPGKAWLTVDDKDNNSSSSLAPGSNIGYASTNHIVRPGPAAVAQNGQTAKQQLNGNNNLLNNEESALFYDWNNDSDLDKRTNHHFGQTISASSSSGNNATSSSSIGNSGLSLQSNPWLFAQSANNSGNGNLIDNLVKNNGRNVSNNNSNQSNNISSNNKLDQVVNGVVDKPILGVDAFKSSASANNIVGSNHNAQHRPATSALFDWSSMTSAIQYNNSGGDDAKQQQTLNTSSSTGLIGSNIGRPGPPPGLLSGNNFAQQQQSAQQSQQVVGGNNINSLFDVDGMQSRDASASLWSGAWLD